MNLLNRLLKMRKDSKVSNVLSGEHHPYFIPDDVVKAAMGKARQEPVDLSLITDGDISLLVERVMESGSIFLNSGWRWNDFNGDTYITLKSGSAPSINNSRDPYKFTKKQVALEYIIPLIESLYDEGFIQRIRHELKARIIEKLDEVIE